MLKVPLFCSMPLVFSTCLVGLAVPVHAGFYFEGLRPYTDAPNCNDPYAVECGRYGHVPHNEIHDQNIDHHGLQRYEDHNAPQIRPKSRPQIRPKSRPKTRSILEK